MRKPTLENLEPRLLLDAELLSNGGFEAGDLTGWVESPVSAPFNIDTSSTQSGSYDISYVGQTADQSLYQNNIALTAGTTYTLTAWYRVDATGSSAAWRRADIGFYPNSGPGWTNGIAYSSINEKSITGWTEVTVEYTPAANETVSVGFVNFQTDSTFGLDNFSLIEPSTNTAPTAQNDSASVDEDGSVSDGVTATDPDTGDTLTYSVVSNPTNGTLTSFNTGTGAYTYAPNANYNGPDSFTFKANDGTVDSNTATVSITVNPVNDAPVASNDSFSVDEDGSHNGSVSATDVDTGDTLTYILVSDVSNGSLTFNSDGTFSYSPTANYNGSDSFTFKANDGTADSNTATISITVTPINDAPVASGDSFSVDQDSTHSGTLIASDVDSSTLTYEIVTGASNGTATITNASTGAFTYDPDDTYSGADSFTFRVSDGSLWSNTATVSVTVNEVVTGEMLTNGGFETGDLSNWLIKNSGAFNIDTTSTQAGSYDISFVGVASDQGLYQNNIALNGGTTYTLTAWYRVDAVGSSQSWRRSEIGFFPNSGPNWGNELAYTAIDEKVITGGWVQISCEYTPTANETVSVGFINFQTDSTYGLDSFSLTGPGGAGNTAPTANDDTFSLAEDAANAASVGTVTATDPDTGDTLTYAITAGNASGIFGINASTGEITVADNTNLDYESATQYVLTVNVSDGVASDDATITVNVTDVNDNAPVASNDTFSVNEDGSHNGSVSATDADTVGTLTYLLVSDVSHGSLTFNADGTFSYTPAADYNGSDSFTFKANDGLADSNTATVSITVTPINDAPVASGDSFSVDQDSTHSGTLTASDVDSSTLTYEIVTGASNGTATITNASTGAFTYDPNDTYDGADSFTFRVSDGLAWSNTATMSVTVNIVNDAPTVNDDTFSVAEDAVNGAAVGTVTANDPDSQPQPMTYSITAGNAAGIFAINSSTGAITVADNTNLDYETVTQYVLTVEVTDGATTDSASITINVTDANDNAPVASNDTFSVAEDAANATAVGTVIATDADTVGTLTYAITAGNASGIFGINASTGEITVADNTNLDYESATQYVLTVNVSDGVASDDATITVNVTDVNDNAPVASNDTFNVAEDAANAASVGTVTATDADTVGTLTYAITAGNASGIFGINSSTGEITVADNTNLDYESATQYVLTVNVSDGVASDDATITVNVTDVNDNAPVASNDSFTVDEDGSHSGSLSATDADTIGTLTYEIVSGAGNGTATITNATTGAFTYDPDADYNGNDSFTFRVSDGAAWSNTATVSITVTPINDAPVASGDSFSVDQDSTHSGTLIASDIDSGTLTYEIVTGASNGTATITNASTGAFTYDPDDTYDGADSFTFRVSDGSLWSNTATVSVTVNEVVTGEMLTNGGFETGDLSNWLIKNSGAFNIDTTSTQAGSYDISFVGVASDQGLYQNNIALTGGTTYTLTAWYRVDAVGSSQSWRRSEVGFFPNSGPNWGNELAYTAIDEKVITGWTSITVDYTPASNETVSVGFMNFQTDSTYGLDSFSLTVAGAGDTTAPAAVSDLVASNPTEDSINLSWTAPGDDGTTGTAASYDVRYSTSPIDAANFDSATTVSGEPTPSAAGTAESMTVSGLSAGTTYYFAIKTVDEASNWSGVSNSPSETTSAASDTTAPAAVSNLATGSVTESSVQLTWIAPGDDGTTGTATSYDIRYSTSPIDGTNFGSATQVSGEPTPQSAGSSESMTINSLSANTTYYFAIKTVDEAGNWSGLSNVPSAATQSSTDTTAPADVVDLQVVSVTDTSVTLQWTATGDDGSTGTASQYDIRYNDNLPVIQYWSESTQVSNEPAPQGSGSTETFTITGLTANTGYSFAFKVADEAGNWSGFSNQVSATTDDTQTVTNLLSNGDFEAGDFSNWNQGAGYSISTSAVHGGTYSAYGDSSASADMEQSVSTVIGQDYKIKVWLKFDSQTGTDWGGLRVQAVSWDWQGLASSGYLSMGTYGSEWFEVGVDFTATTTQTRIKIGYYGGSNKVQTFFVDDAEVFEKAGVNQAPVINSITLTPTNVTGAGSTQTFSVDATDPDGAIEKYVWDFGDGSREFGASGARDIGATGSFTGTLYVKDDEGAVTSQTFTWSVSDSAYPTVSVNNSSGTVTTSTVTVTGSATNASLVQVSTDRGELVDATGTSSWSADVDLKPGDNVLTVQVFDGDGDVATESITIRYEPTAALAVSNITPSASSVERWKTLEITFDVAGSAATHPQFPYDATPPQGMEWVDGCTVDVVFWQAGSPGTTYTRPAFLFQDYDYQVKGGKDWLNPTGDPVWKVRFAPPETGNWEYRIDVTEAKGSVSSSTGAFSVTAASAGNHGFVQPAANDPRYFEWSDGTPWNGSGTGANFTSFVDADAYFSEIGDGANQNFFRWWISGDLWGSAWQNWASRTLSGGGNTPPTALTADAKFDNGLAAMQLDNNNPIMFNFTGRRPDLVNGATYRLRIRLRTEGVTGPVDPADPYGLTVKLTGWPEPGQTSGFSPLFTHVNGDTPWHVLEGEFTASGDQLSSYLSIVFENASAGVGYVDEISLHQVMGDGSLGGNVLQDPEMNSYMNFDPRYGYVHDLIFEEAASHGITFKLVIEEKEEWLLNHWDWQGLPEVSGGQFYQVGDTAVHDLHTYYWRHLMARFGASQAVHSWEFVNEASPSHQNMYTLTDEIGEMTHADGNPHMATTSVWAGMDDDDYANSAFDDIDMGDFHAYIDDTGWLTPKDELAKDLARAYIEYGDEVENSQATHLPWVWGEFGLGSTYDTQLDSDTAGTWLHNLSWARLDASGLYVLPWYTDLIDDNNLHGIFGAYNSFMANVPINNGQYVDANATVSNPDIRVIGQKDLTDADRPGFLWIQNKAHTWYNVVNSVGISAESGTIQVDMNKPDGWFSIEWYDTGTGTVSSTDAIQADSSGILTLTVSNLTSDVAVHFVDPPYEELFGVPEPTGETTDAQTSAPAGSQAGFALDGGFGQVESAFGRLQHVRSNAASRNPARLADLPVSEFSAADDVVENLLVEAQPLEAPGQGQGQGRQFGSALRQVGREAASDGESLGEVLADVLGEVFGRTL